MNNKLFIQVLAHKGGMKYLSISSIALIESISLTAAKITMKEKDAQGNNISFEVAHDYGVLTAEIHNLVKGI